MLSDPLFDRSVSQLKKSKRQGSGKPSSASNRTRTSRPKPKPKGRSSGMFHGANNFVMNNATLIDRPKITQNFAAGKPGLDPVLEHIVPFTDLDAAMDSSARFPPPSCHPGTRLKIGGRLYNWLIDHERQWNMMWLHGPAGTGKSAVAQTFAEHCAENGRLGASFFFSRPNNRNNPDTVIPSIVYQLAVHLPHYKSRVTTQLASDPELLRKARPTLFKKLIIDPLSQLQNQKRSCIREPLLIVLDGLDECQGEDAQRDIIDMISEVVRLKQDFPLLWLICSRPEAHLKHLFSRPDFTVSCGREELVIDAESVADVDMYLRDGLAGIQDHFWDVTTPTWPSDEQSNELSFNAYGHFAFASTALRYIGDLTSADPMGRLNRLLAFLEGIRIGTQNPMEALDALYTRIILDVPTEVLPIVRQMLGFCMYIGNDDPSALAQALCNLFYIDQTTFYRAFRKLHSVIDVPPPEDAFNKHLLFYHASFSDYLRDSRRSDEFVIAEKDFMLEFAKLCLSWYKTDLSLFHTTDGPAYNTSHLHGILPGLTWVSDGNRAQISYGVADIAESWCWLACRWSGKWDEAFISQIQSFDFRYIRQEFLDASWCNFVNRLLEVDSLSEIIRTEPRSEVDRLLLEYMKSLTEPALTCTPATFPLNMGANNREYFLLGNDSEAIICWTTGLDTREGKFGILNCDRAPSKERIDDYQAWLIGANGSGGGGKK